MNRENLSKERLAELLREAERAHGEYEKTLGHSDPDWHSWYAQFIIDRLAGEDVA